MKGKVGRTQQEILDLLKRNGRYATWYEIINLKPRAYAARAYGWPLEQVDGLRARSLVRYTTRDGANLTEGERALVTKARAEHPKASDFVILAEEATDADL